MELQAPSKTVKEIAIPPTKHLSLFDILFFHHCPDISSGTVTQGTRRLGRRPTLITSNLRSEMSTRVVSIAASNIHRLSMPGYLIHHNFHVRHHLIHFL